MGKSLNECIQLARKMEMDGAKFYGEAAAKAVNPQAKRLFESFAADEKRHLGIVEQMARGAGVDISNMPMPAEEIRTVFSKAKEKLGKEQTVSDDERHAIEKALVMETESYRLYEEAAAQAKDAAQKALLERLASEEDQHYGMLVNTQEYLDDNQKWFMWKESALLTGDMSSLGE